MSDLTTTNFKINYHRNGVGGWPFYVVTFDWLDDGNVRKMVATVPCTSEDSKLTRDDYVISVLDIDLLANGDTEFGSNSWRGDHFHHAVWAAIDADNAY